jgi:hypothetical protein
MRFRIYITLLAIGILTYSNKAKTEDNQQAICITEKDCISLFSPIIFSNGGLTNFFRNAFNNPSYARDVLPNDFSHLVQCLEYVHSKFGTRSHARHVIRIFTHKVRACHYINAQAFQSMLDEITPVMIRYFDGAEQKTATAVKLSINKILYDTFLTQFDDFKVSPQNFFDALADDITAHIYDTQAVLKDISIADLSHAWARFLDVCISKLIWHPDDGKKTWYLTKSVANNLEQMADRAIFDSDDLYDLHDALLERYLYFIDIVNTDLSNDFFAALKNDMQMNTITLLDDDNLEPCLESRRERIHAVIYECELRGAARNHGLIVSS